MNLNWQDLLIEDIPEIDSSRSLSEWAGHISGRVAIAFLNRFGVWFLRRSDGPVDMLDVFSGEIERVAETHDELVRNVNERAWQEIYLASKLVHDLHAVGKVPGSGECYGIVPHAMFGGPNPMAGDAVDVDAVMVMPIGAWQSVCARAVGAAGSR